MTTVSALIPTIPGREHLLEKCEAALEACGGDVETIICRDGDSWGAAINIAAQQAQGDYLWMGSDDMTVCPGWWEAASTACDKGVLPAPRVLNGDGSLQSCGEWGVERPDGHRTEFSRIPFCSMDQWREVGPLLNVHFADVFFSTNARMLHGIETEVVRGYQVVHDMSKIGRRNYRDEEKRRLAAEREARRAVALGT